ncbi:MAG: hypothetical protein A3H96_10830 [Acidobacteria bacterium RIFCSPLOWO2_02_FULL_67_36]|nr:MAG: hypothetical protein A3H96_10830 [Acidobacteria bacterium RIFCSPLOWO2_02_FULL_67_36]OFW23906.1 MAG: hypothetical protein A3G21_03200 [Acidobacteria bacterium RIFCSPLOWO2_12_FULL_66_21]
MFLPLALVFALAGQTPVPFPRPGQPPAPPAQKPATPPRPAAATAQPSGEPNETTLGVPLYPGSQFIASYDAGMGQRYYLFGTLTDFTQIVAYYKTVLKQKGEMVFEEPPVHMFDLAKFREESMAFPPSVTVKDYTWAGLAGYLNPKRGAAPERFKTIVQIVPAPPPVPR